MKRFQLFIIILFLSFSQNVFAQLFTIATVKTADRMNLGIDEGIRLIGVEAPEIRSNGRAERQSKEYGLSVEQINQLGKVAYVFVKSLIEGKEVWLEFDQTKRDNSGQMYAYLFYEISEEEAELYTTEGLVKKIGQKYYVFLNALLIELEYARYDESKENVKYQYFLNRISKKSADKNDTNKYFDDLHMMDMNNENRLFYKF